MPPSGKPTVEVTILDDKRLDECQAGCGIDWSSPEARASASQQIKERFGSRIKLTYLNLSEATARSNALRWKEIMQNKNLLSPLLLVNGQLRISGQFDFRQLLDTIEVETELEV